MPESSAKNYQAGEQPRNEVFSAISNEREYQDAVWCAATTPTDGRHSPTEFLVYIQHYLNKAVVEASTRADPDSKVAVLDNLRKAVALGVACMEQNGVVWRDQSHFPAVPLTEEDFIHTDEIPF